MKKEQRDYVFGVMGNMIKNHKCKKKQAYRIEVMEENSDETEKEEHDKNKEY